MVNRERVLKEFYEMIRIKCSSRQEREICDLITARMKEYGFDVFEDNVGQKIGGNTGNLICYLKGNVADAPTLMLSAHMDCVEPCGGIVPVLENGIIRSAGDTILGADDKAGVVGILEAIRCIKEQKADHGDIQVVFTVCEEVGVSGSKNMDASLLKADLGYALDSSGSPGEIVVMAPGQNKINVTVIGKKAHAGLAPEEGVNAIVLAGKAVAQVKQGRIDAETTANVGIVSGGTATNVVPDRVELKCEARSRNIEKLKKQTDEMVETFKNVITANGGKAEVEVIKAYDPYVLKEDELVVKVAKQAAETIGLKPVTKATGGGSDANFFNSLGVRCAVLGVGMQKVHTTDEFIKEEDLYNTAELVLAIIKQTAKMKK